MLFPKLVETTRKKIEDIIASDRIKGFLVGITFDPIEREQSYRRAEFTGFDVLAECKDGAEALQFEAAMWGDYPHASEAWQRKKHPKMHGTHRNSLGGRAPKPGDRYFLYVAWW